ncbi:MAG: acetate kinase, partial [Oscillospiraceae bacterium]
MKILVINAGSSSLKYQLIDMQDEKALAKGNCERIGIDGFISHKTLDGRKVSEPKSFPTHTEAFYALVDCLTKGDAAVIESISEIDAIGHRIVQGAEKFTESTLITANVLQTIEDISDLAPLHNPAHVLGIKACQEVFGMEIPQVGVFDTSFHSRMPATSYMYPIPYEYYEKYHIRKYGFHGTSHRFVSERYAEITCEKVENLKLVSCHLGNGSSICAIDGGVSIDTTMGFTPLDGIIMGTRSGSVDPSVIAYISEKENLSAKEVVDLLNKKSGYLGVSGVTNDHRDVSKAASEGNKRAALAEHIQHYQIKKYIGAYAAA